MKKKDIGVLRFSLIKLVAWSHQVKVALTHKQAEVGSGPRILASYI